ncbi:MAG: ferrous iron transport protein B [Phycisphaerae bacterium]
MRPVMPTSIEHSPQRTAKATLTVAVAGNPNCGKTTLFNALTGLRQKVGNYPGVTVEKREGLLLGEGGVRLIDLPGTYSLSACSPDEQIARDVLLGRMADTPRPDAVLIVVDATNLERNLFLASQVLELGLPAVVACNMMDLVRQSGHQLDLARLAQHLQAPVIGTVGNRGEGVDELRRQLRAICDAPALPERRRRWPLPDALEREIDSVADVVRTSGFGTPDGAGGTALLLLSECGAPAGNHLPPSLRQAVTESVRRLEATPDLDVSLELTAARYGWLGDIVEDCLRRAPARSLTVTDRLDRILTHKIWGMLCFTGMMAAMFYSIFALAEPLMGSIEASVEWAQTQVAEAMSPSVLRDLITDGVIAGVGNVVVFFPQICILFLFIALLEDTGYMARAAFLMDRIMSRVGLHGKSFIPLLSSHACAIPGIMATRVIESPKDRLATILVAPLMSCSARLPVYTVLIAACLPAASWIKAVTLLSMYALGVVAALSMATLFKKTLLRGPTPAFIMELPPYRLPRPGAVLRVMWDRSRLFLTRAGTVILAITVILWAAMSYPHSDQIAARYEAQREALAAVQSPDAADQLAALESQEAGEQLRQSYAGRLGHFIEPVIRPLGYDWKIGIGVIASFAAREVFVGTMGIVYSVGEADEESTPLREQMRAARWPDGSQVFTPLVAVGLMVFYVLACQCASTIAVVRRETNSWRWPLFMFSYMSALAYVGALIVYQAGSALGWGG